MTLIRRLDHVAIAVYDTDSALRTFHELLGLPVVHSEILKSRETRLTYLDIGNTYLQLIEPLDSRGELARWLSDHGEGLHHICFGVDDPTGAAATLAPADAPTPVPGSGRGRVSAFVPGAPAHGVQLECTEFRAEEDAPPSASLP
jgi:methylmalonyl-CoA/ethylmalonyl-CoA epimerase